MIFLKFYYDYDNIYNYRKILVSETSLDNITKLKELLNENYLSGN